MADEDRDKVPRGLPVGLWDWDVLSVSVKDTVSVSRGLREGEGVGEPEMGEKEGVREAGEAERLAVWVTVKESESSTVVEAVREGLVLRLCESVGDPEPVLVGVWVKLPVGEVLGVCVEDDEEDAVGDPVPIGEAEGLQLAELESVQPQDWLPVHDCVPLAL